MAVIHKSTPTSMPNDDGVKNKVKYILLGIGVNYDKESGVAMKRLDIPGRSIYAASAKTKVPVENLIVVDTESNQIFSPCGGTTTEQFTRVLSSKGRPFPVFWRIEKIKPGTEISFYFAPEEKSFLWKIGSLDSRFEMPTKKGLEKNDAWAATQFKIDNDTLSNALLMAADPTARIVLAVFYLVPHCIVAILYIWVTTSAPNKMMVKMYQHESILEWLCVISIYFSIFMKHCYDLGSTVTTLLELYHLADKIRNKEQSRSLRLGAIFGAINLVQIPCAFLLSMYIAIFLSEDLFLNVLLNVVALEFVTEVDDAMVGSFVHRRYSEHAEISFTILDISYAVNEDVDLWRNSSSSRTRVINELSNGDLSNDIRWEALTSIEKGLGLLGRTKERSKQKSKECVISFELHLGVVDWDKLSDAQISEVGSLYLDGTSTHTWEHFIDFEQRALLFKHYPEQTVKFPWFGLNFEDIDLTIEHVPFLVEIANKYEDVEILSCGNITIGTPGLQLLCDGLADNKTLQIMALHHCGLTDRGAKIIAKFLRQNTSLNSLYLVNNRGISDEGALALSAALSDGEDADENLHYLIMGWNNVSPETQEKCMNATNGRIVFLSDECPDLNSYLRKERKTK